MTLLKELNQVLLQFSLPRAENLIGKRFRFEGRVGSYPRGDEKFPTLLISTITAVNAWIEEDDANPRHLEIDFTVSAANFGSFPVVRLELISWTPDSPSWWMHWKGGTPDEWHWDECEGTFALID